MRIHERSGVPEWAEDFCPGIAVARHVALATSSFIGDDRESAA